MSFRPLSMPALLKLSYHARGALVWDLLHSRRIRVLIYHGIPARAATDGLTNRYGYNICVEEFERHVAYLARRCNVLSLDDALAGRGLKRAKINVVITFDDGYENNYTNAFRVLQRYEMPAVFALTTGFVLGREPLWNDVVEYALKRTKRTTAVLEWDGERHDWSLADAPSRLALYGWLLSKCTRMDQERRGELISTALRALDVQLDTETIFRDDDYRPLSSEQTREMARSELVEIASHSVHHFLQTRLGKNERRAELAESKRQLEELTGKECKTFCVPGGQYDREMVDEAFELGYARVLTSDGGFTKPGRRLAGRLGIMHRMDAPTFADAVHGPVGAVLGRFRGL